MSELTNILLNKFSQFFREHQIHPANTHFFIGISGGIDSVVLARLCKISGLDYSLLHCNFNLRGSESLRDENFVRDLAQQSGVEIEVRKFDTTAFAEENKLSVQEAARELRYQWFAEKNKSKENSITLLAHHADDAIETMLMNFFRGTGLQGLTGIPVTNFSNARIARPMSAFRREEILEFAREEKLDWVEDSSNADSKYTRNFFRNELLPAIRKVYPKADENLLRNMERFKNINRVYRSSIEKMLKEVSVQHGEALHIPVNKLKKYQSSALVFEIISAYGFNEKQVQEVYKLMESESGKFIENQEYQIIRHRKWLVIAPKKERAAIIAIEKGRVEVVFEGGSITINSVNREAFKLDRSENIAQLDARHIEYPLVLRRWKQGDYFYPLGMRKKKKLARFFIDQKLSKIQKENIWVLETKNRIIWILGHRIDDRFKITESTKEILQLSRSIL